MGSTSQQSWNSRTRKRRLAALERDGLVTTGAAWGVATTHVQLTDEGQALAEAYVAALVRRRDDADMTAVAAG